MLVGGIKKMGRKKYVILLLCANNDLMVQTSVNDKDIDVMIVTYWTQNK